MAFQRRLKGKRVGELKAFRALTQAFDDLKRDYYVEEYHGARSQVRFKPTEEWRPKGGRCELADLLIVTHRWDRQEVRLTFVQCKREPKWIPLSKTARLGSLFSGNYEQWDLLAARPPIFPLCKLKPPRNVLSDAALPSVGSFLFFFQATQGGSWDLLYSSAHNLKRRGAVARFGLLELESHRRKRRLKGHWECLTAPSIIEWANQLALGQVGSPIRLARRSRAAPRPPTEWLSALLRRLVGTLPRQTPVASRLLAELDRTVRYTSDASSPVARSIVLLALDAEGVVRQ